MNQPPAIAVRIFTPMLLLGALGLFTFFAAPILRGAVYTEDDLGCYHLPIRSVYADALKSGESFLRNPYLFNGFDMQGEGQAGMTHPLHLLLYRFLPLQYAFMLELLLSYPFAFVGMFLFLRRRELQPAAAAYGALLFTFLGFSMNHYVHMHFVAAFAHLPWALWCIDAVMRGPLRWHVFAGQAGLFLTSTSQLLLGAFQPTYFSWSIEGAFAIALLIETRRYRAFIGLGVIKVLALLGASIQLLPMYGALMNSYRAEPDLQFKLSISMRPLNLVQWVQPYLFENRIYGTRWKDEPWDAPYMGAALPPLALLVILRWRTMSNAERKLGIGALALSAFGVIAALGHYGFIYPLLNLIPVVDKLRAPARYLAIAHAGMAMLGALGMAILCNRPNHVIPAFAGRTMPVARLTKVLLIMPAMASLIIAATVVAMRVSPLGAASAWASFHLASNASIATGALLMVTSSTFVFLAARGKHWALPLLACLSLVDAGLYSMRHKQAVPLETVLANIDLPPGAARVDPDIHPSTMNLPMMKHCRTVFGYVSLMPKRYLDYTQEAPLRLAGVHWRQARVADPALRDAKLKGQNWIRLKGAMPYARLVTDVRVSDNPMRDLAGIDIRQTALVDRPLKLQNGPPGTLSIERYTPTDISITTDTDGPQLLVLAESYEPTWFAKLDDAISPEYPGVVRVNGDFLGVVVQNGKSYVKLRYSPAGYPDGYFNTIMTCALVSAYFILRARDGWRGNIWKESIA